MDDLIARIGRVEVDLAALKASSVHFATKGDIGELRGEIGELRGQFGELRGQFGELRGQFGELKALIASVETSVIKWVVGTGIAGAALAFTAASLVR